MIPTNITKTTQNNCISRDITCPIIIIYKNNNIITFAFSHLHNFIVVTYLKFIDVNFREKESVFMRLDLFWILRRTIFCWQIFIFLCILPICIIPLNIEFQIVTCLLHVITIFLLPVVVISKFRFWHLMLRTPIKCFT